MTTNLPLASPDNPLGLEPAADGTIPALTVTALEGDAREPRLRAGSTFCEFLNGNDGYIRAFNAMNDHLQVLAVLIHETYEAHPHRMKEHFLKTTGELRSLAISRSPHHAVITAVVTKEIAIGHIAEFFRSRQRLGMFERMIPASTGMAGGESNRDGSGQATRALDSAYWMRKTQAEDLKNAKAFLQRGLLTTEGIDHFDAWKEDIIRAIRAALLNEREHWATVNRLIVTRLDEDIYQTVSSFIPESYEDMGTLDPKELLRRIEARLVTSDQMEFKRMRFELAKQTASENPWKFESRLLSYYRAAQINDEKRFTEVFKKGVYHDELRKMLMLHEPALVSMATLKAAVHRYQTSLLQYARSTPAMAASATAGLGTVHQEETDPRTKTMRQIRELHTKLDQKTASRSDEPTAMEVDALMEPEEGTDDEEKEEPLFFMAPDHEEVRTGEDTDAQEYWESGVSSEFLGALKAGNVDHTNKSCYHCNRKGHIKANCPERRRAGAHPWTKRPKWDPKKTFSKKDHKTGGGRKFARDGKTEQQKKWYGQKLQQSEEEDF